MPKVCQTACTLIFEWLKSFFESWKYCFKVIIQICKLSYFNKVKLCLHKPTIRCLITQNTITICPLLLDLTELHTLLRPFLLRRIKTEVIKDLPVKTEVMLYHGLSKLQKKCYKGILQKDLGRLVRGGSIDGGAASYLQLVWSWLICTLLSLKSEGNRKPLRSLAESIMGKKPVKGAVQCPWSSTPSSKTLGADDKES